MLSPLSPPYCQPEYRSYSNPSTYSLLYFPIPQVVEVVDLDKARRGIKLSRTDTVRSALSSIPNRDAEDVTGLGLFDMTDTLVSGDPNAPVGDVLVRAGQDSTFYVKLLAS